MKTQAIKEIVDWSLVLIAGSKNPKLNQLYIDAKIELGMLDLINLCKCPKLNGTEKCPMLQKGE